MIFQSGNLTPIHYCLACPQQGTSEFRDLCPLGVGRGDNGEDFNECEMLQGLCSGGTCVNTDGSYRCECPKGMRQTNVLY